MPPETSKPEQNIRDLRIPPLIALAIFVAVFLVFSRAVFSDFVYDDIDRIVSNRILQRDINPISYFVPPKKTNFPETERDDIYRPVSNWFLALEYRFFGMETSSFHLINVLLHSANAVLFFILLKIIFRNNAAAALGALIFGLHPVNTENVAWAWQQGGLWSWFFSFILLIILLSNPPKINLKTFFGALFAGFLAIFTKDQAVILPFLYFAIIFFFNFGDASKNKESENSDPLNTRSGPVLKKIFRDITAFSKKITALFKERARSIMAVILPLIIYLVMRGIFLGRFTQTELSATEKHYMLLTMVKAFAYYLKLLVYPYPLSINYDNFPTPRNISDFYFLLSLGALITVVTLAVILARRLPLVSLGIFWIFIVLAPVSNVIFPTKQLLNERFLYFSVAGLIIALISLYLFFSEKIKKENTAAQKALFWATAAALAVIIPIFSCQTFMRLGDWQSEVTLWRHELKVTPDAWRTQYNAGYAFASNNEPREAIEHYGASMKLAKNSYTKGLAQKRVALLYLAMGETRTAYKMLAEGAEEYPNLKSSFLETLGKAQIQNRQYQDAEKTFEKQREAEEYPQRKNIAVFFAALAQKLGGAEDKEVAKELQKMTDDKFQKYAPALLTARKAMLEEKWPETITGLINTLRDFYSPMPEPLMWLAESFEKSNMPLEALSTYRLALTYAQQNIEIMRNIMRLEKQEKMPWGEWLKSLNPFK